MPSSPTRPSNSQSKFGQKAIREVPYTALLLRTNFVESISRLPFFHRSLPTRVWTSFRRLPMMHRHGWDGPRAPSNTCHAWFIWDCRCTPAPSGDSCLDWFDWRSHRNQLIGGARFAISTFDGLTSPKRRVHPNIHCGAPRPGVRPGEVAKMPAASDRAA
jgi:hypothetical protein